ncbi:MAG: T9SS type A sorting domain-containing protein [Calditrichaeota bacterium]|nr:T9SS type A sorting domain-containing protein [Calditrichota bacterium]
MRHRLFRMLSVSAALLVLTAASVSARTSSHPEAPRRDPGGRRALFALNGAGLNATISNWGESGNPDGAPGFYGFEFPRTSGNDFLFSAGIWVGARVNDEPLVSTTTDGDNGTNEFSPSRDRFMALSNVFVAPLYRFGLMGIDDDDDWNGDRHDLDDDGRPSFDWDGPDSDANGDGNPFYDPEPRIDEDPPGNIANDLLDNDHDGLVDADDDDLDGDLDPDSDDDDGDGLADEDVAAMATQDILAIYDDTDVRQVQSPDPDGHSPLGIRIEQRALCWRIVDDRIRDAVIFEVTVRNIGRETLEEVCFALFADPDIVARGESGDAASADDSCWFDRERRMAVMCDDLNDADGAGPGAFAMKLLATPGNPDETFFTYRSFERLGGGDPETNRDKYAMMTSLVEDEPSDFLSDWRFLLTFRSHPDAEPWQLEPGGTIRIAFAFVGASNPRDINAASEDVEDFYRDALVSIWQGRFIPYPSEPQVFDPGTGNSLVVTCPRYGEIPLVDGVVLRYGDADGMIDEIDMEDRDSLVVEDLNNGRQYWFVLQIYDQEGEFGPVSDTTRLEPMRIPRKPAGLQLVSEGLRSIDLAWSANIELDLAGYRLYRSTDGGAFTPVGGLIEATRFLDNVPVFALYRYRLTALDRDGNESRAYGADSLDRAIEGAPYTFDDQRILIIDETRDGNGNPGSPDDAAVDEFYAGLMGGQDCIALDLLRFSADQQRPLGARDAGRFQAIIWHNDDTSSPLLEPHLPFLMRFVELGGGFIYSGMSIGANFIPGYVGGRVSFSVPITRVFGFREAELSVEREFSGATPEGNWPALNLDRAKVPQNWAGLRNCSYLLGGEPIYRFRSAIGSAFHDLPCASAFVNEGGGRTLALGFPLYFMEQQGALEFMQQALQWIRVDVPQDGLMRPPATFALHPPYPNPFNGVVTIRYDLPEAVRVKLEVYDLSGRLVETLFNGIAEAGQHKAVWNSGQSGSGLYFLKMTTPTRSLSTKAHLIK